MNVETLTKLGMLLFALAVGSACAQSGNSIRPNPERSVDFPVRAGELLHVQRFNVTNGYLYTWGAKRRTVKRGTIIVLKVDPKLVTPRNSAEPILFAGSHVVERLNRGDKSGHLVGVIPAHIDFASEPLWFGPPDLPSRMTKEKIDASRNRAEKVGISSFDRSTVEAARQVTIDRQSFGDVLREEAGNLVLKYSPDEKELVRMWRLPVVVRPKRVVPQKDPDKK